MKFLIILELLFLNACKVIPQSKNDMVKINSVSIYKDFQERGYTTAGAFTHFDDLKKDGIAQLIVDNEGKEKLETIVNRAEKKKHHQTKHGGNLIFCEVKFDADTQIYHRIIISGVGTVYNMFGSVKEERAFITDLTKMIDYKITYLDDLKWLSDFAERIRNKQ
jgi:hypothetical protein